MKLSKSIMITSLSLSIVFYALDPIFKSTGFAISSGNLLTGFSFINYIFLISLSLFFISFTYFQSNQYASQRSHVWEENGVPYFNDAEGQICRTNPKVSLDDFKQLIEEFKEDSEIYSTIKSAYAPFFLDERERAFDEKQRGLVQKFLDVLDLTENKKQESNSELKEKLSKARILFREPVHTDFSREQKKFFRSMGFTYGKHKNSHPYVESPSGKRIGCPATTSDHRSAQNFLHDDLLPLIREHYETLDSNSPKSS